MLKHPEIQAKAQAQLDQVLGKYQLPSFDDEDSLPYITAITKEVLRWHPVTPIAMPHLNTEEDNYKGYTIPANSTIIPNAWYVVVIVGDILLTKIPGRFYMMRQPIPSLLSLNLNDFLKMDNSILRFPILPAHSGLEGVSGEFRKIVSG